ncbi:hypothetical protein M0R72_11135 [Candidatus Pacearchaeota archaeon]|jgi:hypothetical protein|nr:hypothetical protein [Candidatus Pacearchaeota archaeon]
MSSGRETKRARRQALQDAWSVKHHHRQQEINDRLLEIPDVCYRVPNLRRIF